MRPRALLAASLLASVLVSVSALAGQLWTVQAVRVGREIVCDAFAAGAAGGRPPYEIRFRRSASALLLVVSYDGPPIAGVHEAIILQDGASLGTLRATTTKFGDRHAIAVSLDPRSVSFADLEQHRLLTIMVGHERFDMGLLPSDSVANNMDACLVYRRTHAG